MKTTMLKPGLLVQLKTRITGGVEYRREDLAPPTDAPPQADAKRWETTRIVSDPQEWERARACRAKAQTLVRSACIKSDFGLLCPVSAEATFKDKVDEALALADVFNSNPENSQTRVEVYVLTGRIADNDEQAARALASEVRGLLDGMNAGIANGDPEAIRAAANRARSLGAMLSEEGAGKVKKAIAEAREAAKAIVKRVKDGGEDVAKVVAKVVAELKLEQLHAARFAFLDMDKPAADATQEQLPSIDAGRVAGLDLGSAVPAPAVEPAQAVAFELDAPVAPEAPARAEQRQIDF